MQIAYLIHGAQRNARGKYVTMFFRVVFAGPDGVYRPRPNIRYFDGPGFLNAKRGVTLDEYGVDPYVNPKATPDDAPDPSYLWFSTRQKGVRWLTTHGYRPLHELEISEKAV